MSSKNIELLEEASKDVENLAGSMRSHKAVIDEFDTVAKSIIQDLDVAKQQCETALSKLVESSSSIADLSGTVTAEMDNMKVAVRRLDDSNLKIIDKVQELSKTNNQLQARLSARFDTSDEILKILREEVRETREELKSLSFFSLFRRKK